MIVPDTTVWIDYFNGVVSPQTDILRLELVAARVIVTDVIILEVLQGFRNDKDYDAAAKRMNDMKYRSFWGKRHMRQVAKNYQLLRKKGITIRSTIDVIIATFCIENGYALLHHDRDFDPMEKYLGLKVVRQATVSEHEGTP
jgi:predicted nucleic acid-binding protein